MSFAIPSTRDARSLAPGGIDGMAGVGVAVGTEDKRRLGWWASFQATVVRHGLPRTLWALVVGMPRAKVPKLKPSGYNAFVERITQPMLIIASIALTTGAVFVMAQGLIQQASDAIAAGHIPSFQTLLALGTLFVIGFLIDTSLITAGSRFRMHALRGEVGWALLSCAMLLLCVGVEGMTWSYLLYELEPTVLPANVADFIRGIPSVLFFVRAYMGPLCLIYLTAGVLPLTIQRGDVDRQTAALTGSAIVAVINTLVRQIQDIGLVSPQQAVSLLDLLLALFRVAAKHQSEQDDRAMVEAFRNLSASVAEAPAALTAAATQRVSELDTALHEKAAELARLTEQYQAERAAWQEERERLSVYEDGVSPAQVGQVAISLPTDEQAFFGVVERAFDTLRERSVQPTVDTITTWIVESGYQAPQSTAVARALANIGSRRNWPSMSTSVGARSGENGESVIPRSLPKPGTKAFRALVSSTILTLQREDQPRTFFTIAARMGEAIQPDDVKAAFDAMRRERQNKLRPGVRVELDPVLDDAALLVPTEVSR